MAITQIKGSNIADGTVVAADVADDAVTTDKILDNAVTGTKIQMGSDATGDIITYNGSNYIRLARGTAAQVLKVNTGGTNIEWGTDAGGIAVPGSSVRGDTLYHNGTVYTRLAKGSSGQVLTMGANDPAWAATAAGGKILQVVSTTKTDTFSHATATFTDVTGLSVTTGTLASTSSKILVTALINGTNPTSYQSMFQLVRTSTAIGIGDAAGSRTRCSANLYGANSDTVHPVVIQFLESGSFADTSAVVYKIQIKVDSGTPTMYINRSYGDSDSVSKARTVSTITAMEIGA